MLLVIVTVIALLVRVTSKNEAGRARAMRIAVVAGGLTIFVLILGSTTIVSTRKHRGRHDVRPSRRHADQRPALEGAVAVGHRDERHDPDRQPHRRSRHHRQARQ
jgi:hypothetical protein